MTAQARNDKRVARARSSAPHAGSSAAGPSARQVPARARRGPAASKHAAAAIEQRERERVEGIQRARMLSAVSQVVAQRGAANLTVAHVVEHAGVSRRTFYELFSGAEECLLAALEQALSRARERVLAQYDAEAPWRTRIRAALVALLRFFEEEPATARLLVVEALAAGPTVMARRRRALEPLIAAIDEGRKHAKDATAPAPLTAEGVVGGAPSATVGKNSQASSS